MSWARIDDGFHSHPKVQATSLAGRGLFVTALSYSAHYLTDGFIPEKVMHGMARGRGGRAALRELLDHRLVDSATDGYTLHDFLDFNMSRVEVEAERAQNRRRQADHRARGRQSSLPWDGAGEPSRNAVTNGAHSLPTPSLPEETPQPPASGGSAEILWQRVKDQLRARLSEIDFAFQVEPVEATAYEDGRLELQAPAHNVGYLRSRYLPLFGSVASELEEGEVEVVLPESGAERQAREHQQARQQRADRRARRELGRDEDAVREEQHP